MPTSPYAAYVCTLTLEHTVTSPRRHAHPLSIWEAIVKGITEHATLQDSIRPLFHCLQPQRLDQLLQPGRQIELEVMLIGAGADTAQQWQQTAEHYFDPGQPGKNFRLLAISAPQALYFAETESNDLSTPSELCLEFHTPFPFKLTPGRPRTWLDSQGFAAALQTRIKKLFGHSAPLPAADFRLLPYYWHYRLIPHQSRSQRGHTKFLNGCVGPLYLQGEPTVLAQWLPWLQLAERIGIGGQIAFGLGRFQLKLDSPAYFHGSLLNPQQLEKIVQDTLEQDDAALLDLAEQPAGVEPHALALQLVEHIKTGWQPQPYRAFQVPKPHGGSRIIELAAISDRIMQRHLLRLLQPVLDSSFGEASIGFRKGLSRETAVQRIHAAIDAGCDHIVQADIADFFPSVDIERLCSQLEAHLPQADQLLKDLLLRILHTPRRYQGQLQTRQRGLATGSPLSPLLANVYLDSFDQTLSAQGIRLIRYADDFIILTKGRAAAEQLLVQTEQALHTLGLSLQQEKTAIKAIAEGFVFLGIGFGVAANAHDKPEAADSQRKPVYINEAFVALGVHDDALQISQRHHVLAHVPLRRISEIHSFAPCSWSAQLVGKTQQFKIPLLITTGNGKSVVGMGGYSARQYEVAHRQALKFYAMSELARLAIAKGFALGKLHNYQALLRQRYQPGDNLLLQDLNELAERMQQAETANALRGLEGIAAQKLFTQLGSWIQAEGFVWQGRCRRPADRINALLNFGYHLLFCRLNVLVRSAGLNPFLGFLHQPTSRYEALVCDLQELFRPHVDRLVLRLLNRGMITQAGFIENERGCWLKPDSKHAFLAEFAREFEQAPPQAEQASVHEAMALQVRFVTAFFMEDRDITWYRWGRAE